MTWQHDEGLGSLTLESRGHKDEAWIVLYGRDGSVVHLPAHVVLVAAEQIGQSMLRHMEDGAGMRFDVVLPREDDL